MCEKELQINNLLNLEETIATSLFEGVDQVWEVLPKIGEGILRIGAQLPTEDYNLVDENIWISKTAEVASSASITGPCIIGHKAQIRHSAFIRGNAIIGNNAIVGNSTEIKNAILFNHVQVPHFNYVGDSILGYKAHMGAGSITSNVKSDKSEVSVIYEMTKINTGLNKFGVVLGDNVEIGSNSVLNPGTIIGRNTTVYPLSNVRGFVHKNCIYKKQGELIEKR